MSRFDNTNSILPMGQPGSYMRSSGRMAAVGSRLNGLFDGTQDATAAPGSTDMQTILTGINMEAGYFTNLIRGWQGLPPLPASVVNPGVQVGLDKNTMILAGVGIVALLMVLKKR